MWAVLLGVILLLVAATSSRGATRAVRHGQPAARAIVVGVPAHPAAHVRR
jgi:hypothetical protein